MTKYVLSTEVVRAWKCSKQFVASVAKREGWRVKPPGDRPYWYRLHDVEMYMLNRDHSERARKEYGHKFRGMLRHDGVYKLNNKCPVCLQLKKPLDID